MGAEKIQMTETLSLPRGPHSLAREFCKLKLLYRYKVVSLLLFYAIQCLCQSLGVRGDEKRGSGDQDRRARRPRNRSLSL